MPEPMHDQQLLNKLLDALGSEPGSILVRGPDMWITLPPGPIGWVLIIGAGGVPEWADPATVTFG